MLRIAVLLTLSLAACSKPDAPAPASSPPPASSPTTAKPTKDPEAARKLVAEGAVVIDVRTPDEFAEDHLTQATNIPIEDFAQRITEVDKLTGGDKTKPLVVYCASGNRSGKAQQQLEAAGYARVVNGGSLDDLR
ncbi:MAG: rhodanese-like domain-containing protein [Deltaproteobacteria bacterium]|nr:rhodanese-like domain-containing protein [Deltaproteobacteria bacterium]